MSETITVSLKKPITVGEGDKAVKLTELTFREVTVGDLCLADAVQGEMTKTAAILSGMTGVDLPTIKQIGAADISAIMVKIGPLLGEHLGGMKIGTT